MPVVGLAATFSSVLCFRDCMRNDRALIQPEIFSPRGFASSGWSLWFDGASSWRRRTSSSAASSRSRLIRRSTCASRDRLRAFARGRRHALVFAASTWSGDRCGDRRAGCHSSSWNILHAPASRRCLQREAGCRSARHRLRATGVRRGGGSPCAGALSTETKTEICFLATPETRTRVQVLAFGISKIMAPGWGMTRTVCSWVSPAFMSPNRSALPGMVDGRSDILSAGRDLWQLLPGTLPSAAKPSRSFAFALATDSLPLRASRGGRALEFERVFSQFREGPAKRLAPSGNLASALLPFRHSARGTDTSRYSVPTAYTSRGPSFRSKGERSLCTTVRRPHGQAQTRRRLGGAGSRV